MFFIGKAFDLTGNLRNKKKKEQIRNKYLHSSSKNAALKTNISGNFQQNIIHEFVFRRYRMPDAWTQLIKFYVD